MSPTRLALLLLGLAAPAAAERHPVFSLVDNQPLGHLQRRGGLYIPAGLSGMAKYIHFSRPLSTWKLRAVEDGRKVALPSATATLSVPLTAAQAAAKVVHLSLKAPPASSVKVTSRGKSSPAVALQGGWQIVTVPLPDGALAAGENRLQLNFAKFGAFGGPQFARHKTAAAVELIQVGGTAPPAADPLSPPGSLLLPGESGLAHYAFIPRGGALAATATAGPCRLTVRAEGLPPTAVPLDGKPVDLAPLGGRFVRLELAAAGCPSLTLSRLELLGGGAAPTRPAPKPPTNVVLWLTDNTRADRFKLHNPKSRVETPVFDALAKRGTLFRYAFTQGNESRVSHASLFSSLYPSVHNMIADKTKLRSEIVTLPESLKPTGRQRLGVMGNGYIDAFWGFGEGWDWFKNNLHGGGGLSADALLKTALSGLDKIGAKPFFLYLGTIDAHVSWRAHEPWLAKYDPTPYAGPFVKACLDPQLDQIVAGKLRINERDKVRILALYDADISYNDHVLGKLLDELKRRGRDQETMVVMTSDHGEEFWEHGRIGHGQSLHQELIHVPLLIVYPPYFPGGHVVEEGVDVMDVYPTITEALGAPIPDAVQGESLIGLANGIGAGYPRPAIASQYELAHAMQLATFKLRVGGNGEVQLWDATDLREEQDLSSARPVELRAVSDAMGLWMANRNQWQKRKWGVASNLAPAFAADLDK